MMIGIAGPSASGKTTLAEKLTDYFTAKNVSCNVLSLDDYYIEYKLLSKEDQENINFDNPSAIEFDLFRKHLEILKNGKCIPKIKYIHSSKQRISLEEKIIPSEITIVEGLYALHDKDILEKFDLKIYIDTNIWTCLQRRLERATNNQKRTEPAEQMMKRYVEHVVPGYYTYIKPTKRHADIILNGEKNFNNKIIEIIYHQVKQWEKK